MRIGELSRRTGVSVPTIKYYVREGLLPAGRLTSPNQASYEETHVRRLRLIRALLDVGGLSVAGVGAVVAAIDDEERSLHDVLGEAAERVVPRYEETRDRDAAADEETAEDSRPPLVAARAKVAALIDRRGWRTEPEAPASEALAFALAALDDAGHGGFADLVDDYAEAAERVAHADLDWVARNVVREELVESVVIGTVMGDAVFSALRRMAHVDASDRLFGMER
ncbi:MerR family transcriptional regulator [Streptomyces sp. NPDC004267]|uniref:MerR family transcriptional regulator n=1 Tax=Streptomyces sp. NPDC004267 TaxID=3364694 RepID=UPI003673ED76